MVIAHRLSTIKDANCIYVIKKGELMESGRHEQLLDRNGLYAELVKTQLAAETSFASSELGQEVAINDDDKSEESTMLGEKEEK